MKNIKSKLLYLVVTVFTLFSLLPYQSIQAAVKKTTIKSIEVKSTKAKSDTTYNNVIGRAETDKFIMILRENKKGKTVLQFSEDGKVYKDIDIISIIKNKFKTDSDEIIFHDFGSFDNKIVYITGRIEDGFDYYNFLLTTKDGSKWTSSKLECTYGSGFEVGYIYKLGSTYVYTVREGEPMGGGLDSRAPYWISKDLKEWEMMTTPKNDRGIALGVMWSLVGVGDKAMVIAALDEDFNPYQLYYTTDLKTFNKITKGINNDDSGAKTYFILNGKALLRREVIFKGDKLHSIQFLMSTNCKTWKKVIDYKQSNYKSVTTRTGHSSTDKDLIILFEREKDNSLFSYSSKNNSFTEYSTPIKVSLMGSGVYSDKYSYMVYDSKYILVSNDNFVTAYKIKTPLKNIDKLTVWNNILMIHGENNYYIKESDIEKAIKALKK